MQYTAATPNALVGQVEEKPGATAAVRIQEGSWEAANKDQGQAAEAEALALAQPLYTEAEALALSRLLDVARGLHYLHAEGICHGDLKAQNVLIDRVSLD